MRQAACKNTFRADLVKDLDALDAYDVPPAPVHISNSTDPLQPLELEHRHALYTFEKLAQRRCRFTTVTVLTKNPAVLTDQRYIRVLHELSRLPVGHPRREWFEEKRIERIEHGRLFQAQADFDILVLSANRLQEMSINVFSKVLMTSVGLTVQERIACP